VNLVRLWPSLALVISNSIRWSWFSSRLRKPDPWIAEKWTKTSGPPDEAESLLHVEHLTVP
jgi:hypothetical protein